MTEHNRKDAGVARGLEDLRAVIATLREQGVVTAYYVTCCGREAVSKELVPKCSQCGRQPTVVALDLRNHGHATPVR